MSKNISCLFFKNIKLFSFHCMQLSIYEQYQNLNFILTMKMSFSFYACLLCSVSMSSLFKFQHCITFIHSNSLVSFYIVKSWWNRYNCSSFPTWYFKCKNSVKCDLLFTYRLFRRIKIFISNSNITNNHC